MRTLLSASGWHHAGAKLPGRCSRNASLDFASRIGGDGRPRGRQSSFRETFSATDELFVNPDPSREKKPVYDVRRSYRIAGCPHESYSPPGVRRKPVLRGIKRGRRGLLLRSAQRRLRTHRHLSRFQNFSSDGSEDPLRAQNAISP